MTRSSFRRGSTLISLGDQTTTESAAAISDSANSGSRSMSTWLIQQIPDSARKGESRPRNVERLVREAVKNVGNERLRAPLLYRCSLIRRDSCPTGRFLPQNAQRQPSGAVGGVFTATGGAEPIGCYRHCTCQGRTGMISYTKSTMARTSTGLCNRCNESNQDTANAQVIELTRAMGILRYG